MRVHALFAIAACLSACATVAPPEFARVRVVDLSSVSSSDTAFAREARSALFREMRGWSRIVTVQRDSLQGQVDAIFAVRAERMEERGLMSFGVTRVELSGVLFSADGDSMWSATSVGRQFEVDRALRNAAREMVRYLKLAFRGRPIPTEEGKGGANR